MNKTILRTYNYDIENDIWYKDIEPYKHFMKIISKYPYWKIAQPYITIYLEPDNYFHTSFFDDEEKSIHFLYRHIDRFTIIHEFTHFIQYLTDYDVNYLIDKNVDYGDIVQKYKDKNDIEPYITFLDIFNSVAFGEYAHILGTYSHTIKYYKDTPDIAIQEMHSNYMALKLNNEIDLVNEIPQPILDIILTYDKLIQEKLKDILDKNE